MQNSQARLRLLASAATGLSKVDAPGSVAPVARSLLVAPVALRPATRCAWATTDLLRAYHDSEWGVPIHDDRLLFEFLILEGAQAGLSWETILNKRESYRAAFDHFAPASVAKYDQKKRKNLLSDAGIVRNRLKIEA